MWAKLAVLAAGAVSASASVAVEEVEAVANPIRKVVTLLQNMQKKVEKEGEKEKELYEKFMCYCKTGGGELSLSINTATAKVPALQSEIEASEGKLAQTKEDLKTAQADRAAAKDAIAEATAIREKEAKAFAAEKAEYDANIGAISKAVAALERGMSGGFLQTDAAQVLRRLVQGKTEMIDYDRQEVIAFLSGGQAASSAYAPRSGEVTGILKEMGATMQKALDEATAEEETAAKSHEEMVAAKQREVTALTDSIEAKTEAIGTLGVSIVTMKADLTDTEAALIADQQFLKELDQSCKTKTAEWEERMKTRAEELVALADTIKILNDDDALDLFKKTLPGASSSFVQLSAGVARSRARAIDILQGARDAAADDDRTQLDLLLLALTGKKGASRGMFDKVIKMVDEMIQVLKKEQTDDDNKHEYCSLQLDAAEDRKKELEHTIHGHETAIDAATEAMATLGDEITALEKGIKDLDKSVAEATEQRKAENVEYKELMSSDAAAKDILNFAKNRLHKFYNPKMYQAPAKKELTEQGRIAENMNGAALVQISAHQHREAPPPPPETWGAYQKKSDENTGVIAMIDLLIRDLDKEMTEAEADEKHSQADYEKTMSESVKKRAADSKLLAEKSAARADAESELQMRKEARDGSVKEHMATGSYIASLHSECDWLVQYYDVRKEARAGEVDSLQKAKAVLSGADFALVQTRSRAFLQRA